MARSVAEARIAFGLVSIPVHLYVATQPHGGLGINMLHDKCGTRIRQQLYCPTCDVKVERAEIVKGYEFEKGKFVRFTAAELATLEEESSQDIDIVEFVPVAAIDPVYYDKPYYLGAAKRGDKAYLLLAQALIEAGRVGVGSYSARGRNYLVMIRPRGASASDGLVMHELLYGDEVRDFAEVPKPDAKLSDKEVKLALQIIEQGSHETFDPSAYRDERRAQIQKRIDEKVTKGGFSTPESKKAPTEMHGDVIDLVAILQASLKKDRAAPMRSATTSVSKPTKLASKQSQKRS